MSDSVYIFVHIPKTGGTTLRHHLQTHLEPHSTFIHLADSGHRRAKDQAGLPAFYERSEQERNQAKAIIGHQVNQETYKLVPGKEPKHIVFFREPVSWVVSRYNWTMNSKKNKGEPVVSFDEWFDDAGRRQSQVFWFIKHFGQKKYARFKSLTEKLDYVNELLSSFAVVSLTERLNEDAPKIFRALGVPEDFESSNVAGVRHEKLLSPSDELREKLAPVLDADLALYELLKSKPSKIEL